MTTHQAIGKVNFANRQFGYCRARETDPNAVPPNADIVPTGDNPDVTPQLAAQIDAMASAAQDWVDNPPPAPEK